MRVRTRTWPHHASPLLVRKDSLEVLERGCRLPRGAGKPFSSRLPRCATDHNVDNTTAMLREWLAAVGRHYAAVIWRPEGEPRSYPDEEGPKHWTRERHQFLMELKQEALTFARDWGADYILVRKPGGGLGAHLWSPHSED